MNDPPLAEKLRPKNLNDVIGQAGLVNKGKIIHQIIDCGNPVSLILWERLLLLGSSLSP
jgi:putative ATPase